MTLSEAFAPLVDPRIDRHKQHNLQDMALIAVSAILCGADGWSAVAEFGRTKQAWLQTFLQLPNGIPSHDTFGRVFSLLDPTAFQTCFLSWVKSLGELAPGSVVAIDGKTLRHSYSSEDNKAAIHRVSAWGAANGLVLGQLKTAEKSNEITMIPALLKLLALDGTIVTIDAMGCQKTIARQIRSQRADYVLALKGNQKNLYEDVKLYMDQAIKHDFAGLEMDRHEAVDGGHGRVETRRCWTVSQLDWLSQREDWQDLKMVGVVELECDIKGAVSIDRRYFISSLTGNNARQLALAVRQHWGIENRLHWVLDVGMREDECRIRKDYAAENMAVLRHMVLNLLRQEKTVKLGIPNKRLKAGWDERYLQKILGMAS